MATRHPPPPGSPFPGGAPAGAGAGNNTKAIAALATGIAGIVFAICCSFVGLLLGIAAVVLGYMSKQEIARSNGAQGGGGLAQGGFITGIVAVVLAIIMIILGAANVVSNLNG